VIRHALVGFVGRLLIGIGIALLLALLLALVRDDGSYAESFRISSLLVACLLLLLGVSGESPAMRGGTVDPWLASFFPRIRVMNEPYAGTRVSSAALFVLAALVLGALGLVLG
jgi:hypothetical protein